MQQKGFSQWSHLVELEKRRKLRIFDNAKQAKFYIQAFLYIDIAYYHLFRTIAHSKCVCLWTVIGQRYRFVQSNTTTDMEIYEE
jgi:hypothetical protein